MTKQDLLNDVSKKLKTDNYNFYHPEEKTSILSELLEVIDKGTIHQSQRALKYMKQIGSLKYK